MTSWVRVTLIGAVAIILFDALVAFVSVAMGISYAWGSLGSIVLYALVGYSAARTKPRTPLSAAALAGAVVGLADASGGWAISWAIGPGVIPGLTVVVWILTALFVVVLATGIATLGGIPARARR